jgi:4-hydroxybenzoate polyprenyltransferase
MKPSSTNNISQHDELIIKQDTQDGLLQVLVKEYELTLHSIDNIDTRIFQFITIALGALTFAIGYMITQKPDFTRHDSALLVAWLIGAWLLPSLGLILFSILIFQGYLMLGNILNARILSLRINDLAGQVALLKNEPMTVHARFFSTRRGSPKIRLLYIILFGCAALFYPAIVFLAYMLIYQQQSHLAATLFLTLYVFLGLLFLFIASGLMNELPKAYDRFLDNFDGSQPIPYYDGDQKYSNRPLRPKSSIPASQVTKTIFASVLPRPADVIVKGPFFIYGFVAASIITGLNGWNLQLLNTLFGEASTSWKSIAAVPIWAIVALCMIYFIVEEILLQQAKLIWDDIRDRERDKLLLRNCRRAIASGQMSISSAKLQLALRLFAALLLGYILGGFALVIVFLLICLHQMIYVLWSKPRSARDLNNKREQRELLFFLSFSVPLRFLAGVVAVTGSGWALSPYILFYALFYFCSFGALAAFWKIEAKYYEKKPEQFRSQSQYFLDNGRFWQFVGLLTAVLVSTSMVVIQALALFCVPAVSSFYGECTLRSEAIHYIDYGLLGIPLVLILIMLFGIISWGLVRPFRSIGDSIAKLVEKAKSILTKLFFTATIVTLLLFLPYATWNNNTTWNSVLILFLGFFFLNGGYFFFYEGMTYEQYTNEDFRNRLPKIKKALGYLLFEADKNIGLRRLIIVAKTGTDPDTWQSKKVSPP